ncbi:hypothetical protein [Streptomyces sp. NPDC044948]|uniref:hypothetical protein n=1 Tax=Streptomyces sp. NPDC044948 TaxID=3157092 RepID=UPI0033E468B6
MLGTKALQCFDETTCVVRAGTVTGLVDGIAPVSGLLNTAVGTVEGVTGLNTAPVTGLVAGL